MLISFKLGSVFFFKQKTAYEITTGDWSSDVCSSDLQTWTNQKEHPAVQAWSRLHPGRVSPGTIETLKRNKKSAIYRLRGVGPKGSAVIAKRCLTATALTERILYQDILPCLPVPSLRYFGFLEDQEAQFCWLF